MRGQHRRQALRVAGVNSAATVGTVLVAAERAVAQGRPFEDFQRQAGRTLLREWQGTVANPSARMRTIYINVTSTALNHGRWEVMTRPEALRVRPFFRFVSVDDSVTTFLCRRCRNVVLPATHPFWKKRWPPLHHRCRSCVTSLTVWQAQQQGVAARAPDVIVPEGFGRPPTRKWEPDMGRIHPLLHRAWRKRLKAWNRRTA